jgi:hypothetical protein
MVVYPLKAVDLVVGSRRLGTPTLGQVHHLVAKDLTLGQAPPEPPAPGHGTLEAGIEWAILTLWPGAHIPKGLKPRDRNNAVHGLLKSHGYTLPANGDALERAVQRVLRKWRLK